MPKCVIIILLLKMQQQGLIEGVKVARNSPAINHLLFADDAYIFLQVNVHSCRKVREVLDKFYLASGQCLNHNKSELLLSPNRKGMKKR